MTNKAHQLPNNVGVAIVAPGGYAPDEIGLARGIALLEKQGCMVRNYYDPATKYQRFGGTDEARVAQLHDAADDPNVQVILALRGGYGMSRILPMLDLNKLANSGKLFVGHSDFTALQMALLAKTNTASFAGPMLCDDFTRADVSDFTMEHFWRCLTSASHTISAKAEGNPAIKVSGKLWGGNLAMLTHLTGTPYLPQIDGGILFVEDINEHPYRVERMLLQLLHAGILGKQKAIVLGDFSNYRLTDYDNGYDFVAMLAYLRAQLPMPVITGLPFGHIQDKVTLAVGCHATLSTDAHHMQLVMNSYPHLS
ncbi:MAG TPA: muramoyltetrapeptide carboxypeptidase [Burkholderiaceae bacterium]|jgi:muramoyltetrapeptide carboxypeptidase